MSLLSSIADIWEGSAVLCALIPFDRVFTGRVPQTQQYPLPYCSILVTQGRQFDRSSKARYMRAPLAFHIWVDDADLSTGEAIAHALEDEYAERCWTVDTDTYVIDVLDEGPACIHQTELPTVKAWEVVKLFSLVIQRDRVSHDADNCCPVDSSSSGGA